VLAADCFTAIKATHLLKMLCSTFRCATFVLFSLATSSTIYSHYTNTKLYHYYCLPTAMQNRAALESIGGFAYGSITEDFLTSLTLAAAGYRCKYFLLRMTRGVSPKELESFMVQVRVLHYMYYYCLHSYCFTGATVSTSSIKCCMRVYCLLA
jgi:cellulose synthase/poly-beta-1,6-N-acetylglucosamine synthase-like glycosyltransferase